MPSRKLIEDVWIVIGKIADDKVVFGQVTDDSIRYGVTVLILVGSLNALRSEARFAESGPYQLVRNLITCDAGRTTLRTYRHHQEARAAQLDTTMPRRGHFSQSSLLAELQPRLSRGTLR